MNRHPVPSSTPTPAPPAPADSHVDRIRTILEQAPAPTSRPDGRWVERTAPSPLTSRDIR